MFSMERLASCGVIPVVVLNDVADAVPTARALLRGGIDVMEITFRTAAARDCIAKVAAEVPEIIAGAGTVVNVEQAREAVADAASTGALPGGPLVIQPKQVHGVFAFAVLVYDEKGSHGELSHAAAIAIEDGCG